MGIKYKLKLKDLKIEYLKEYFSPLLNYFKKTKKIENYSDLKEFIQKKSAWVSQVTLYGYLKTRMGAKYVLMLEDEIFLGSINKAKWNIYIVALQDLESQVLTNSVLVAYASLGFIYLVVVPLFLYFWILEDFPV